MLGAYHWRGFKHGGSGGPEKAMDWQQMARQAPRHAGACCVGPGGQAPHARYSAENMHDRGGDRGGEAAVRCNGQRLQTHGVSPTGNVLYLKKRITFHPPNLWKTLWKKRLPTTEISRVLQIFARFNDCPHIRHI